jgi:hypothetical protein
MVFLLYIYMTILHKWARLLKQQSLITVCRSPTKENKLPFPFLLQQTNGSYPFANELNGVIGLAILYIFVIVRVCTVILKCGNYFYLLSSLIL